MAEGREKQACEQAMSAQNRTQIMCGPRLGRYRRSNKKVDSFRGSDPKGPAGGGGFGQGFCGRHWYDSPARPDSFPSRAGGNGYCFGLLELTASHDGSDHAMKEPNLIDQSCVKHRSVCRNKVPKMQLTTKMLAQASQRHDTTTEHSDSEKK